MAKSMVFHPVCRSPNPEERSGSNACWLTADAHGGRASSTGFSI
jgi:hypothetical protein